MSARKSGLSPVVIREAPPSELKIYRVFEHQLDLLAQGSPASLMLNFSLFFLGVAASAFGTLVTAPPAADRVFYSFLIVLVICLIAGIVLLVLWLFLRTSTKELVAEIKSQMPPNPPVPEQLPEPNA